MATDTSLQREDGIRRRTGPCDADEYWTSQTPAAAATMARTPVTGPLALGMLLHRAVASRAAAAAAMATAHSDDFLIMALHPQQPGGEPEGTPRFTGTRAAAPVMATPAGREAARHVQVCPQLPAASHYAAAQTASEDFVFTRSPWVERFVLSPDKVWYRRLKLIFTKI